MAGWSEAGDHEGTGALCDKPGLVHEGHPNRAKELQLSSLRDADSGKGCTQEKPLAGWEGCT